MSDEPDKDKYVKIGLDQFEATLHIYVQHYVDQVIMQGYSEDEIVALKRELTGAGADWQLYIYGRALHAFTNPGANDPEFGTVYDAITDRRSKDSLKSLLKESFEE